MKNRQMLAKIGKTLWHPILAMASICMIVFFDGGIPFYAAAMMATADWLWKLWEIFDEPEAK